MPRFLWHPLVNMLGDRPTHTTPSKLVIYLFLGPKSSEMSKSTQYLLISLPASITPSESTDEAFEALKAAASSDQSTVTAFRIPEFKIGTLDTLVQQADELGKLELSCEAVANKVGETLRTVLEGDEAKIAQQKTVNDSWS